MLKCHFYGRYLRETLWGLPIYLREKLKGEEAPQALLVDRLVARLLLTLAFLKFVEHIPQLLLGSWKVKFIEAGDGEAGLRQ